jgi:hypothetical protein
MPARADHDVNDVKLAVALNSLAADIRESFEKVPRRQDVSVEG